MGIKSIALTAITIALSTSVNAAVFEFHFTGQYTLIDQIGGYMDQQAIDSTLTYDDSSGAGFSAGLTIANFDTFPCGIRLFRNPVVNTKSFFLCLELAWFPAFM